ncbi:hypothetical protein RF11_13707 [Thelohanellus kitauei]|uniref:D-arabinono-1,4-lactone oxidase C-terminal domain-containing protein n=1 Tax=Thelohanellus kitauei TaxID=669202 RepID=A0A0C2ILG4_THEKT|nr:hypothetical protein RF11_13707 [Thelohanellus kitauei]
MHVLEYSFPIEKTKFILRKFDKLVEEQGISANAPVPSDLTAQKRIYGNVLRRSWRKQEEDLIGERYNCFLCKLHRCSYKMLVNLYGDNIEMFKKIKNEADPDNLFINEYYMRYFEDTDSDELILKNISFDP